MIDPILAGLFTVNNELSKMTKVSSDIKIICLEKDAFYALFDDVIAHIKSELPAPQEK